MTSLRTIDAGAWYEIVPLGDGISLVHEPWIKPFYRCNMWHVRGRDRDLLFDTGLGVVPLRRSVACLAERPLICIASHTHFDHIGGHHEFPDRRVHQAEATVLADPRREWTLADRYANDDMFDAFPPGWDSARYSVRPAPPSRLLVHGDVIDLGDRTFEVVHTPGHSPGSIALWEARRGVLFSGDIIYDGPLVDDAYHSNLEDYEQSLARLARLPLSVVHGGHFPSFGRTRFNQIFKTYLAGHRKLGCHLAP